MKTSLKQKQQHLDLLISSQEDQKQKGNLTQKGIDYLDGLKSARKLLFGEPYVLTFKCQLNKRGKDKKSRSYLIYFLNGIEILKQKLPYDPEYDHGFQHHTGFSNEYLLNGRIYQTREKFKKIRDVSFPISKRKLTEIGVPTYLKLELTK